MTPSPSPSDDLHHIFHPTIHPTIIHPQSHHLHISDRVDTVFKDLHKFGQARIISELLDDQSSELPAGAYLLQASDSDEPTIHVQVAQVHDMDASTEPSKAVIDTKYTVDKAPYLGRCSLCVAQSIILIIVVISLMRMTVK